MGFVITQSTIWKVVGAVSAITGPVCFGLSCTYKISFGKLGIWGLLFYLLISSIMLCLIYFVKRIRVPEKFRGVVGRILYVLTVFISVKLDELVPGKSDAFSIILYGLLALMSLCNSRKSELGFETVFFSFFHSLFLEQICKTNWKLFLIAVIFGFIILFLRDWSQSASPNGDRSQEVPLINGTTSSPHNHEDLDLKLQDPPRVGKDSGESLSSTSNQEKNQEAPNEAGSGNGRIKVVLIEGRDLDAAHLKPFVRVRHGNRAERTKVICGTRDPIWSKTLEFPDDRSHLVFYVMDNHVVAPTKIDAFELAYRSFPLNHMVDKWIPLKGGRGGKIHIQITRKVSEMLEKPSLDAEPSSSYLQQIPT